MIDKQELMNDLSITNQQISEYSGLMIEKLFCICILKLPEKQRISILTDFINMRDILYNGEYQPYVK